MNISLFSQGLHLGFQTRRDNCSNSFSAPRTSQASSALLIYCMLHNPRLTSVA